MEAKSTYHNDMQEKYIEKLRLILSMLPDYVTLYFRSIEYTTTARTKIAYAQDLKVFFEYLAGKIASEGIAAKQITTQQLEALSVFDIEAYLEALKLYSANNAKRSNHEKAIKRKLCSLRSFFAYLYRNELINQNPVVKANMPKIREEIIVRMDEAETASLLDHVEQADGYSKRKEAHRKKNMVRNLAIVTLLLGTGIRVSECVGLDLSDVDFANDRVRVIRKGGYEAYVYFGEEVRAALIDYSQEREKLTPLPGHENAFFISAKGSRISVRSIEVLVKDYAREVVALKKITPHKLRSTYGTALYKETGDIYLVAEVLGHKDVNTTRKHYAELEDARRRSARNKVTLRKSE